MYKSTVFVLLCTWMATASKNQLFDNIMLNQRSVLVNIFAEPTCKGIYSCADCKTALICKPDGKGGFTQLNKIPCPATTPYCEQKTGTCTKKPDESCGESDKTFVCLGNGNFPDANCKTYHICDNYIAFKYQCAIATENYDPELRKCMANAPCGTYKCPAAGVKVRHTEYPQYYAYCTTNNIANAVYDRCKGSYELNITSQICEPVCHQEGVQQDLEDCKKYYRCHNIWVPSSSAEGWAPVMVREHLDCPKGTAFDRNYFLCVDIGQTDCPP